MLCYDDMIGWFKVAGLFLTLYGIFVQFKSILISANIDPSNLVYQTFIISQNEVILKMALNFYILIDRCRRRNKPKRTHLL